MPESKEAQEVHHVAKMRRSVTSNPTSAYVPGGGAAGWGWGMAALDGKPFFTWYDIPRMIRDPRVRFLERMWRSPFQQVTWTVKASSPAVEKYVDRQLRRFWRESLPALLQRYFWFGFAPGGAEFSRRRGLVRLDGVRPLEPHDAKPMLFSSGPHRGRMAGLTFGSTKVFQPHAYWFSGEKRYGPYYDMPPAGGMFEPWVEKRGRNGAIDMRRTWFHQNSSRGKVVRHPPGRTEASDEFPEGRENQSIAREILDYGEANSSYTLTNELHQGDPTKFAWEIEFPESFPDRAGFREYPKDLDAEMAEGVGIPREVLEASATGSGYSGRQIPLQAWLGGADEYVGMLIRSCEWLKWAVMINFGPTAYYEIEPESLVEKLLADSKKPGGMGGAVQNMTSGQPPQDGGGSGWKPVKGPRGGEWEENPEGKRRHARYLSMLGDPGIPENVRRKVKKRLRQAHREAQAALELSDGRTFDPVTRRKQLLVLLAMLEFQRRAHGVGDSASSAPYLEALKQYLAHPNTLRYPLELSQGGVVTGGWATEQRLLAAIKKVLPTVSTGPDYQKLYWNPQTKTAWWVSADGDDEKDVRLIKSALAAVPGVDDVRVEAEYWPKDKPGKPCNFECIFDRNHSLTAAESRARRLALELSWRADESKAGHIKAVGEAEHAGMVLYGPRAEAALRAQEGLRDGLKPGERDRKNPTPHANRDQWQKAGLRAREILAKVAGHEHTQADLQELSQHLQYLPMDRLMNARSILRAKFKGVRGRLSQVGALMDHIREQVGVMDQKGAEEAKVAEAVGDAVPVHPLDYLAVNHGNPEAMAGKKQDLAIHDAIAAAYRGEFGDEMKKAVNKGGHWDNHGGDIAKRFAAIGKAIAELRQQQPKEQPAAPQEASQKPAVEDYFAKGNPKRARDQSEAAKKTTDSHPALKAVGGLPAKAKKFKEHSDAAHAAGSVARTAEDHQRAANLHSRAASEHEDAAQRAASIGAGTAHDDAKRAHSAASQLHRAAAEKLSQEPPKKPEDSAPSPDEPKEQPKPSEHVSPNAVFDHFTKLHGSYQDDEKDAIFAHKAWKLVDMPIEQIPFDESKVLDPDYAREQYAHLTTTPPAIVMTGDGIIDGMHRVYIAKRNGEKTIPAYVPAETAAAEEPDDPKKKTADPDKTKIEMVRAAAGGQVSDVDGKFYAGGQLMPIHGLSPKVEKKPKGTGTGDGGPAKANEDKEADGKRPPRKPMSPEEIEAEKQRREEQAKWNEIKGGALGKLKFMTDKPLPFRNGTIDGDKWKAFAEDVGEEKLKQIVDVLRKDRHAAIDADVIAQGQTHLPKEDIDWEKDSPERAAESDKTMFPRKLGSQKKFPSGLLARQHIQHALEDAKTTDRLHAIEKKLGEILNPPKSLKDADSLAPVPFPAGDRDLVAGLKDQHPPESRKDLPVQDVPVASLRGTQEHIDPDKVKGMQASKDDLPPMDVVKGPDDTNHVEDGHHRGAAAHASGDETVPARVWEKGEGGEFHFVKVSKADAPASPPPPPAPPVASGAAPEEPDQPLSEPSDGRGIPNGWTFLGEGRKDADGTGTPYFLDPNHPKDAYSRRWSDGVYVRTSRGDLQEWSGQKFDSAKQIHHPAVGEAQQREQAALKKKADDEARAIKEAADKAEAAARQKEQDARDAAWKKEREEQAARQREVEAARVADRDHRTANANHLNFHDNLTDPHRIEDDVPEGHVRLTAGPTNLGRQVDYRGRKGDTKWKSGYVAHLTGVGGPYGFERKFLTQKGGGSPVSANVKDGVYEIETGRSKHQSERKYVHVKDGKATILSDAEHAKSMLPVSAEVQERQAKIAQFKPNLDRPAIGKDRDHDAEQEHVPGEIVWRNNEPHVVTEVGKPFRPTRDWIDDTDSFHLSPGNVYYPTTLRPVARADGEKSPKEIRQEAADAAKVKRDAFHAEVDKAGGFAAPGDTIPHLTDQVGGGSNYDDTKLYLHDGWLYRAAYNGRDGDDWSYNNHGSHIVTKVKATPEMLERLKAMRNP